MANEQMPALFVGHGAPFNLLSDNVYVRAWQQLGEILLTPREAGVATTILTGVFALCCTKLRQ